MPFPMRIMDLFSPADVGATGTKVIDVELSEIVSRIIIKFKATNVANSSTDTPFANLTKIELVDGSTVLFSLNGDALDAVNFYDGHELLVTSWSYVTGWATEAVVALNFGRFIGDTRYALDPTKFRNVQLKITYDEDVASAGAIVNELHVWAEVFSGLVATPEGMLIVKEQYTYTPAAMAYEEIELPTDYVLRSLYLQHKKKDTLFGAIVNQVRLDEDALKSVMFDDLYKDLMKVYRGQFGRYAQKTTAYIGATETAYYRGPTADITMSAIAFGGTERYIADNQIFGAEGSAISDTANNFTFLCTGSLPHYVGCFPFGERMDPSQWYNPRGVAKLRFRVMGGDTVGTTATFRVITQQVRPY